MLLHVGSFSLSVLHADPPGWRIPLKMRGSLLNLASGFTDSDVSETEGIEVALAIGDTDDSGNGSNDSDNDEDEERLFPIYETSETSVDITTDSLEKGALEDCPSDTEHPVALPKDYPGVRSLCFQEL